MELAMSPTDSLGRQASLVRVGCALMIAAAGMRAAFTAAFETDKLPLADYWTIQWSAGYLVFIVGYTLASQSNVARHWRTVLLVLQSASALYLVWLYPNFLVTAL